MAFEGPPANAGKSRKCPLKQLHQLNETEINDATKLVTNQRHLGQPCQAVAVVVVHQNPTVVLAAAVEVHRTLVEEAVLLEVAAVVLALQVLVIEQATSDPLQYTQAKYQALPTYT